ncbi:MAG: SurA N-terminal domain-containing protein [Pontibacterium sp.]
MLQQIRDNSQSIVAKVIVGLIAITFALFGVESLVSLANAPKPPATVNGEDITEVELAQAADMQRRQLMARMGENFNPALLDENLINNMALDGLVEKKVMLLAAKEDGLVVSDAVIDQMIVNTAAFQVDGKFDRNVFESTLRSSGLSPLRYRALLEEDRLLDQERSALALSAFSFDGEVDSTIALDQQTRDIQYVSFSQDTVSVDQTVTPEQLQAAYDAAGSRLDVPEQLVLEYLMLERDALASEVELQDSDIQAAYDTKVAQFEAQEERGVAHILIEVSDERSSSEAEALANELKARIDQGEDFAAVAAEASDDIGSASMGGELGVIGKGVFSENFEEAMFALNEGEVSAPVETEFGYHLVKVTSITETQAPTFEEAEAEIIADLTAKEVQGLYVDMLEQLSDISYASGDLVEPSKALGLEIQTTEPVTVAGGSDPVTQDTRVMQAAFGDELKVEQLNSSVIELNDGQAVVVRVKEVQPARASTLEEVSELLTAEILAERTQAALTEVAASVLEDSKAAGTLTTDGEVNELKGLSRIDQTLPSAIVVAAFNAPKPAAGEATFVQTSLPGGDVAVVAVTGVTAGDVSKLTEDDRKGVKSVLASREGQQAYTAVAALLNEQAEVERR